MKPSTIAAVAALLSTSSASTVMLETTRCLNADIPTQQFAIEINTEQAVPKTLPAVCGLRILSASDAIDVRNIVCQAFRDTAGTQPGSAFFTYDTPALIATNPVQELSIRCSTITSDLARRQLNPSNSTASSSRSVSRTASVPRSSVTRTSTSTSSAVESAVANVTSSVVASTILSTVHVSASPSASGNGTGPSNTGRPTATQTNNPNPGDTNVAGRFGVSIGLMVVAFVALLL